MPRKTQYCTLLRNTDEGDGSILDISHFTDEDALQFIREVKIELPECDQVMLNGAIHRLNSHRLPTCTITFKRRVKIVDTTRRHYRRHDLGASRRMRRNCRETHAQFNARYEAKSDYTLSHTYTALLKGNKVEIKTFSKYFTEHVYVYPGWMTQCRAVRCNEFTSTLLALTFPDCAHMIETVGTEIQSSYEYEI